MAFVSTLAINSTVRGESAPEVEILGSGATLSVLISSDHARVLIANGDDGSAFANALARSRGLLHRRIDVLVIAGDAEALPGAQRAVRDAGAREVWLLAGPLEQHAADLGIDASRVIYDPTRIKLPGVDLVVYPSPSDGEWSADIKHERSRIVVGTPVGITRVGGPHDVAIIAGRYDKSTLGTASAAGIVVSTRAASARRLRTDAAEGTTVKWLLRVEPGSGATIRLSNRGLVLPNSATEIDVEEPRANSSSRSVWPRMS